MNHLDGVKVKLIISFKDNDLGGEPSFYISNILVWEAKKKILQTYAFRWMVDRGFSSWCKAELGARGLPDEKDPGRKKSATCRWSSLLRTSSCSLALVLIPLCTTWREILRRTIGSRCRMAGTEILSSLVRFVLKMSHKDMDARKIIDLLTQPLENSGYYGWTQIAKL